ncbi:MAG: TPM domain-containing protein [Clostridia bacterium]|nr:TPM domain-containing protein [Clostridia bacterium]
MKKIITTLIVAVFALSFMLIPASADDFNTLDPTGLLTEDEMLALEQLAVDIEEQYGYFAMICFAENTDGYETILDFGHDLYNSFSDKDYAVIFVDDLSQSLCDFFVSENYEECVFTYDVTNAIFNAYNEAETYYLGAVAFYNGVASALENAGIAASEETTAAEEITESVAGTQDTTAVPEETTAAEEITESAAGTQDTTAVPEETTKYVNVDRVLPLVVDNADILTDEEEAYFLERCQTFTDEYKCEIAIVTITDLEGKTAQEYADDFYDYNGYGYGENKDGLLCLYLDGEEGQRNATLTTNGTAQMNIGDDEIEDILLAIAGSAKFGEFKDAFDWYIDLSEEAVKPVPPLFWLLICLAVGMVIGLIITNSMASKNYSVHKKETAADYVREGTLMITGRNDVFRNTRVNVTPKPKSNSGKSSDSNGSTHTSSSGRSHGGGSISF